MGKLTENQREDCEGEGQMGTQEEKKERQIKHQITLLRGRTYQLSDGMDKLLKRLDPVLSGGAGSVSKVTTEDSTEEDLVLVDIAEGVRQSRYSVESNLSVLAGILIQLEI